MFEKALVRLLYRNAGVVSARQMTMEAIEIGNPAAAAYWTRMTIRRSRALSRWTRLLCRVYVRLVHPAR